MVDDPTPPLAPWPRAATTVGWLLGLIVFVRWWEAPLQRPFVLIWTTLFGAAALGTAWVARSPARLRPAAFGLAGVVVVSNGIAATTTTLTVAGVPFPVVAVAAVVDLVVPLWLMARTMAVLWRGGRLATALLSAATVLIGGFWWMVVRMPGSSFTETLPPLSETQSALRARLEAHVGTLAGTLGARNETHFPELLGAAAYIDSVLRDAGYEPIHHPFSYGNRVFHNLEVSLAGRTRADEIVVVGAHYDSAADAPGADDNASGVAGLLEIARALAAAEPDRSLRLAFFANEEPPFFNTEWMGSQVYANEAAARGENIVAMMSLETIGYYSSAPGSQQYPPPFSLFYPSRGDFIGFVGNLRSSALLRRALRMFRDVASVPSEGAAAPTFFPGITWSDHAAFWRVGYSAIMVTDTAPFRNPHYHTLGDTPATLDYPRMARVVEALVDVVRGLTRTDD